jgi:uncharacterized tellurite resistance protein B-like protein
MFLAVLIDEKHNPELLEEIARIADKEPEFTGQVDEFEKVLAVVQRDLHDRPEEILPRIAAVLPSPALRRRGLELAMRVVTADGIVSRGQRALLRSLADSLELSDDDFEQVVTSAQRRLVRFMMVYLVYLTALSDGVAHPSEFEEMIPFVLKLPAFSGVTTEEYERIVHSVRDHLEEMQSQKGIDYITATLRNAAEILEDEEIPVQALRMVARGIFADQKVHEKEREFFRSVAKKLDVSLDQAERMIGSAGEKA